MNSLFLECHQYSAVVFGQFVLAHVNDLKSIVVGQGLDPQILLVLVNRVQKHKSSSNLEIGPGEVYQSVKNDLSLSALDFTLVELIPLVDSLPVKFLNDILLELFLFFSHEAPFYVPVLLLYFLSLLTFRQLFALLCDFLGGLDLLLFFWGLGFFNLLL